MADNALACSPSELITHVLPALDRDECQALIRAIEGAKHAHMTLCFTPDTTDPVPTKWTFKHIKCLPGDELELLARKERIERRLYAHRKAWKDIIHERLEEFH